MAPPENVLHIVAIFVQSMLYGMYLVTFFWCLKVAHFDRRKFSSMVVLAVTLLLFICSTLNLALGLHRLLRAFTQHPIPDAAVSNLKANWVNLVKVLLVNLQLILFSIVLIFRCWIIWNRNTPIVIFPLLCWIATVATTVAQLTFEGESLWAPDSPDADVRATNLSTSAVALSLGTDFYATAMIIFALWRFDQEISVGSLGTRSGRESLARKTIRTMIESGALQTAVTLISVVAIALKSNVTVVTSTLLIEIPGIAYNLILIRSSQDVQRNKGWSASTLTQGLEFGVRERTTTFSRSIALDEQAADETVKKV